MSRLGAAVALLVVGVVVAAVVSWLRVPHQESSVPTISAAAAPSAVTARPRRSSTARAEASEPADDEREQDAAEAQDKLLAAARALKDEVIAAMAEKRWNDALRGVNELRAKFKDDAIRKAIGLDELEAQVVAGRDAYFCERMSATPHETMDALIAERAAREPTIAAARTWANRELDAALWEQVSSDLDLKKEELERYWKDRRKVDPRTVSYGAGSFIAVKPRERAGSPAGQAADVPRAWTDEDWWSAADTVARTAFLTAYFVETSGRFVILRADETACDACRGRGFVGEEGAARVVCRSCNGCGAVRSVMYR